MASTTHGDNPAVWIRPPCWLIVTGKRARTCRACGCNAVAQTTSQWCVETAKPAARPAANRKYCIHN
eukprot:3241145-Lingulodinium_polyedra.AAC.1